MLEATNLPLLGHHHSGIDDCRNLARLTKKLVEEHEDFEIRVTGMVDGLSVKGSGKTKLNIVQPYLGKKPY